jgi:glutamyl-Q tRNA(Asp) synthetase
MTPTPPIGRFAPSPTGDLHFGSLVAALGSFLEARTAGGKWLLRVEDIDPPREVAGSANRIIGDLQQLGMVADGQILYQSSRHEAYQAAVTRLLEEDLAYPCACSRKDIPASGVYPGTCRSGIAKGKTARAIRFRVPDASCEFTDRLQGRVCESLNHSCGDFIIQRADGLIAYQLAVVIDDHFQAVTQVVRGADLLDSTNRQICLQKALALNTPEYMHLPVVLSNDGKKLSKRSMSDPLTQHEPAFSIYKALRFLGQNPPDGLTLDRLWEWSLKHWDIKLIPRSKGILPSAN